MELRRHILGQEGCRPLLPSAAVLLVAVSLIPSPGCNCKSSGGLVSATGLIASPSALDFGDVPVGSSLTKTLTLTNPGSANVQLTAAAISGDADFQLTTPAPTAPLPPGGSAQLSDSFAPTTQGPHSGTLTITSNATPGTNTVQLTGNGISFSLALSPNTLDFGCVEIGTCSAAQTLAISNSSTNEETVAVGPLGADAGFLLASTSAEASLQPGQSTTVSITFCPSTVGAASSSCPITPCPTCPPQAVGLTATGADTRLVATPAAVDIGSVPSGTLYTAPPVVVQAEGLPAGSSCALPATLTATPSLSVYDAGFSLSAVGWPATLTPPASAELTVAFQSDGEAASDTALVPYSVGGVTRPTLQIPISANVLSGACSALTVTPNAVDFGSVPLGSVENAKVAVSNGGTVTCVVSTIAISQNDAANEFGLPSGSVGPLSLAAGASASFSVSFAPTSNTPPLLRKGILTLTTADPTQPQINVPLSAALGSACGGGCDAGAACSDCSNSCTPCVSTCVCNSFNTTLALPNGSTGLSVAIADLNGDGQNDLALGNGGGALSVFLSTGAGTFAAPTTYSGGDWFVTMSITDVNGDGRPDILVVSENSGQIAVYLNQGAGVFPQTPIWITAGTEPLPIDVGDFNGDGAIDFAVANNGDDTMQVFLNQGSGNFVSDGTYPTGTQPFDLRVGDVNGDGNPDVVVLNANSNDIDVFLGQGNGNFTAGVVLADGLSGANGSAGLLLGDFNGDKKLDIFATGNAGGTVFLGNGDGTFQTPTTCADLSGYRPGIGDLDGDGNLDLVLPNLSNASSVNIAFGIGDGTFRPPVVLTVGSKPRVAVIGDLNGDGKPDIAANDYTDNDANIFFNGCP